MIALTHFALQYNFVHLSYKVQLSVSHSNFSEIFDNSYDLHRRTIFNFFVNWIVDFGASARLELLILIWFFYELDYK